MAVDRSGTNRLPWPSLARVSPNVQVAGGVAAIMGAAAILWQYRRQVGMFVLPLWLLYFHASSVYSDLEAALGRGAERVRPSGSVGRPLSVEARVDRTSFLVGVSSRDVLDIMQGAV